MQFKVPQDVQQADRIVSFLTLTQLIICIVGFGLAYGTYAALNNQGLPMVLWLPPVLIIGALTCAFAFLKIANLPFHQYLALLIERFMTPSKRVWVKGGDRVIEQEAYVSTEDKKTDEKSKKLNEMQQQKEEKMQNISEITDVLDTIKEERAEILAVESIDKTEDKDLLQKAFLNEQPSKPKEVTTDLSSEAGMVNRVGAEKIKSVSQLPKETISPPPLAGVNTETGEKKKRKRRRRRKKKTGEPGQNQTIVTAPQTNPAVQKSEPVKPVITPAIEQRPSSAPTSEIKKPASPTLEQTKIEPSKPAAPSWLSAETPSLNMKSSFHASSEAGGVSPDKGSGVRKGAKEEGGRGAPLSGATKEVTAPTHASSEAAVVNGGRAKEEGEPEKILEAPEPELDLPAPVEELELEAPKPELDLPAPTEELELEPPEQELKLSAPSQEQPSVVTPSSPNPPNDPNGPNNPSPTPPPKVIKPEETFTADQLKQGQVIKIPNQK